MDSRFARIFSYGAGKPRPSDEPTERCPWPDRRLLGGLINEYATAA